MAVIGQFGGACVEFHHAYIFDRGGETRIAKLLDISSIQWERDRDGMSEATLRIEGSACSAQANVLSGIEPKRHELVIFRGNERVWEGPIWRVGWHKDWVEINAHDIFQYLLGTPLTQAYDNRYRNDPSGNPLSRPTEVLVRMEAILNHELLPWEALSPEVNVLSHMVIHHAVGDSKTTAYTRPYEMTVGEHFQDLAHYSGIDWTCIGRSFHAWDVHQRALGQTRTVTEADFLGSEVVITAYGSEHTQNAYVIAEDGIYGEAHATEYNDYYGPWTTIYTAFNEEGTAAPSQTELNSQASRNISGRQPVPVEVRVPDNSSIRLNDTLGINDLVPGVRMPVLATLNARQMSQMQKLDHLTVTEDASGENIQVVLTPATNDDSQEGD